MKKICFLDLDGVLVNFCKGALKAHNITDYEVGIGQYGIEKWKGVDLTQDEFWDKINKTNEFFWAELEKFDWSDELVDFAQSLGEVFILTAPSRNPYCAAGKKMWIQRNYPKLARKVILTSFKYLLAAPNRILIDDHFDQVNSFTQAGGRGVLFPQLYNSNHMFADNPINYVKNYFSS